MDRQMDVVGFQAKTQFRLRFPGTQMFSLREIAAARRTTVNDLIIQIIDDRLLQIDRQHAYDMAHTSTVGLRLVQQRQFVYDDNKGLIEEPAPKVNVMLNLSKQQITRLRTIAHDEDVTMSKFIRRLIDDYLAPTILKFGRGDRA